MKRTLIVLGIVVLLSCISAGLLTSERNPQKQLESVSVPVEDIIQTDTTPTNHKTDHPTGITGVSSYDPEVLEKRIYQFESVNDYEAVSMYGPMPDFLSDVGFDGGIDISDSGELIVSYNMRLLFDFFLAAIRTEGMDTCSSRISEYIDLTLPPAAAAEAKAVWESYRTYKLKMKEVYGNFKEAEYASHEEYQDIILTTLEMRNNLRRECMPDDVIDAFFSEEEAHDQEMMAMLNKRHEKQ